MKDDAKRLKNEEIRCKDEAKGRNKKRSWHRSNVKDEVNGHQTCACKEAKEEVNEAGR
uniref:Uncharacterized protein n=1 Tax=Ascaris lumbricoides TaxID=6252 RepID=A0A0M3HZY1_ASCLU